MSGGPTEIFLMLTSVLLWMDGMLYECRAYLVWWAEAWAGRRWCWSCCWWGCDWRNCWPDDAGSGASPPASTSLFCLRTTPAQYVNHTLVAYVGSSWILVSFSEPSSKMLMECSAMHISKGVRSPVFLLQADLFSLPVFPSRKRQDNESFQILE